MWDKFLAGTLGSQKSVDEFQQWIQKGIDIWVKNGINSQQTSDKGDPLCTN